MAAEMKFTWLEHTSYQFTWHHEEPLTVYTCCGLGMRHWVCKLTHTYLGTKQLTALTLVQSRIVFTMFYSKVLGTKTTFHSNNLQFVYLFIVILATGLKSLMSMDINKVFVLQYTSQTTPIITRKLHV